MARSGRGTGRGRSVYLPWWQYSAVLWLVVVLAHFFMLAHWWKYIGNGLALEDLNLYREWAFAALNDGVWQGIDTEFIYPLLAMPLMVLPALPGGPNGDAGSYQLVWFLMTAALNAAAIAVLTRGGRRREAYVGAYWWLAITMILNYVAFARVDGISTPIALMGIVLITTMPLLAGVLLAAATWIKVWPAGIIAAAFVSLKQRWDVVTAGLAVTVVVAVTALAMGNVGHLLSFLEGQGDRGMQLEAPLTTPGVWQAMLGWSDAKIAFNHDIITQEVLGGSSDVVGALVTPLMILAVGVLALIAGQAIRRGRNRITVFLITAQAMVGALVVFNKVGSPQFMLWLAPVVAVGLAHDMKQWRVSAAFVFVIAILTAFVYPHFYVEILRREFWAVMLLTVRNLLVVAAFAWTVWQLWCLRRSEGSAQTYPGQPVTE